MGLFDHYISPTSSATESSKPTRERIYAALKARGITPDDQGKFSTSQDFRQRIEAGLSAARRSNKFTRFFAIAKKYDLDEDDMTKAAQAYIKANPELEKYLTAQGLRPEDVSVGRKGESVTLHGRELEGGEVNDPLTGKPVTAGTYDLVGKWKSGKFVVTGLAASETKSPTVGEARESAALEFGYRRFADAPPEAKQSINDEIRIREAARGRRAERADIRGSDPARDNLREPLPPPTKQERNAALRDPTTPIDSKINIAGKGMAEEIKRQLEKAGNEKPGDIGAKIARAVEELNTREVGLKPARVK